MRRRQIVDAAIEVIAERGYAKTSFGKIAERAGLSSTGMISYHFRNKDDLMNQVVLDIYARAAETVGARIEEEATARGQLLAFITASIDFYRDHHRHMRALAEISLGQRATANQAARSRQQELVDLEDLFRSGQRRGEFREFDPHVMALALRHALDGIALHLADDPNCDTGRCARELASTFDLATRAV